MPSRIVGSVATFSSSLSIILISVGERERIWTGVMYLYGIDTKKAPDVYLHSNDDIREAMMAKLGWVVGDLAGDDSSGSRAAVAMLVRT